MNNEPSVGKVLGWIGALVFGMLALLAVSNGYKAYLIANSLDPMATSCALR